MSTYDVSILWKYFKEEKNKKMIFFVDGANVSHNVNPPESVWLEDRRNGLRTGCSVLEKLFQVSINTSGWNRHTELIKSQQECESAEIVVICSVIEEYSLFKEDMCFYKLTAVLCFQLNSSH